jgi:hypothetical protein
MQQSAGAPANRQFERSPVKTTAFIHRGGNFQRAQIVDYSPGGLQLRGTFGLIKQDHIQVELMSGLRITAKVAWSLGSHTGVVFPEPLPPTHPAILELACRASKSLSEHSLSMTQGSRRHAQLGSMER